MIKTPEAIKQNECDFFYFEKNNYLKSVLLITTSRDVNIRQLFVIFKIYTGTPELLFKNISIIIKDYSDVSEKNIILRNISKEKIQKMSFIDFETWYEESIDNDFEYVKEKAAYGFSFNFFKESIFWEKGDIFISKKMHDLYLEKLFKTTNEFEKKIIRLLKENKILTKKKIILENRLRRLFLHRKF